MNDENSRTNRAARYITSYDRYANPVTLTYNQKKTIQTVPGGICSLVSCAALTYFILASIVTYTFQQEYQQQTIRSAVGFNPPAYVIKHDELNVLTKVQSTNPDVAGNLDAYFSGVYI